MRLTEQPAGGGTLDARGAGRSCPRDYRYDPATFRRPPDLSASALIVVGGLYGNTQALDAVEALAATDPGATVVFNGDAHWFDADPALFGALETRLARYPALRGNVETEIARDADVGAGCGCAYPADVDEGVVARSNIILDRLHAVARQVPGAVARLARLPMSLVADVGGLRVGIVHGDAWSLAGWDFAHDALDRACPDAMADLSRVSGIDVFASTHTCLPALRMFGSGPVVINNGAAGMPNFRGTRFGLVTRIGTTPSPVPALYGIERNGVRIEALPLPFDTGAFDRTFAALWPAGSPAHESYATRIAKGPAFDVRQAMPQA
jgi:hypothetical protein